jgi:hypothetical protein
MVLQVWPRVFSHEPLHLSRVKKQAAAEANRLKPALSDPHSDSVLRHGQRRSDRNKGEQFWNHVGHYSPLTFSREVTASAEIRHCLLTLRAFNLPAQSNAYVYERVMPNLRAASATEISLSAIKISLQ